MIFFIFVSNKYQDMKKNFLLVLLIATASVAFAQKSDKVKGSKIVTIVERKIAEFETLQIENNLEVHLERGEKAGLKVETDDNLQDVVALDENEKTLRIYTLKKVTAYKKLIVRVTYTENLKTIQAKDETTVNAIQELLLDSVLIKASGTSKLFLNINSKSVVYQADDKAKGELNIKSEKATIEMSKNSSLKALVTTVDFKTDLYQKADAALEGDASNAILRLDNNSSLTANKLTMKNTDLTIEGYATCAINTSTTLSIDAANKTEIQLVGNPKITIKKFADETKLIKKLK
jgi:hypothetical protein